MIHNSVRPAASRETGVLTLRRWIAAGIGAAVAVFCLLTLLAPNASADVTIDCSQPVTHSITLTSNESCADGSKVGIIIGANDITINLNGYQLETEFGPVIQDSGHSGILIENGTVTGQGTAIELDSSRRSVIRNVHADGGSSLPPILLQNGLKNTVIATTTDNDPLYQGIMLNGERHDVIAHDAILTQGTSSGLLELDNSRKNLITDNTMGEIKFNASNRNLVLWNTVISGSNSFGLTSSIVGDGNFNLLVRNVTAAPIALTGSGNVLLGNSVRPTS